MGAIINSKCKGYIATSPKLLKNHYICIMDKENLKTEIELLKIYALFVIVLTTGIISFLLRDDFFDNKIVLMLSIIGTFILVAILQPFLKTYFQIKKTIKK